MTGNKEAQREIIRSILLGDDWTQGERAVVKWQLRLAGDFKRRLFECIATADEDNQLKLSRAFPEEVAGFQAWAYGDLGKRLRATGLLI